LAWRKNDAARWTLGYYLLFLCLGLDTVVLGPTLPALAEQTHTPLGRMGWLFLAGAIGYTLVLRFRISVLVLGLALLLKWEAG
jgi:MFS family permease